MESLQAKTPLFISSIELLAHSTELFAAKNERKFKFMILHLANAVELILKDRLVTKGTSIYVKNSNKTLSIWECVKGLELLKIDLPELPVLEMLIDDRNSIQHRFGFPDRETVFYYITVVMTFFKRFLNDEYNIDLKEELTAYLEEAQLELIGLTAKEQLELKQLKNISIDLAIIKADIYLESEYRTITRDGYKHSSSKYVTPRSAFFIEFFKLLIDNNFIEKIKMEDIKQFKEVRNQVIHGQFDVKSKDAMLTLQTAFNTAMALINGLEKAKNEHFFDNYNWDLLF